MARITHLAVLAAMLGMTGPTRARETLGLFHGWAAFSDPSPRRCYAIAEPERRAANGLERPFASIATWPARGIRSQLHVRLRKPKLRGAPVILTVGDARFALIAGGAAAWAPSARADARIVAAVRQASRMTVATRARDGGAMVDGYALLGAATAIDGAALACAGR